MVIRFENDICSRSELKMCQCKLFEYQNKYGYNNVSRGSFKGSIRDIAEVEKIGPMVRACPPPLASNFSGQFFSFFFVCE